MQNQKTLQQMIREYELNMPPEIMDLIKSFDWKKEVRMIVNQNQLMFDIGADLEESVYLMILGVVDIGEIFNRFMEVHELPEDKVQKILQEVERQVFTPMHHKLAELEKQDAKSEKNIFEDNESIDINVSRDEILSEIEKDEPEIIVKINTPKPVDIEPQGISFTRPDDSNGAREPFSFTQKEPVNQNVIEDSVGLGLTESTVAKSPDLPPPPPRQNYAVDPYREPIE